MAARAAADPRVAHDAPPAGVAADKLCARRRACVAARAGGQPRRPAVHDAHPDARPPARVRGHGAPARLPPAAPARAAARRPRRVLRRRGRRRPRRAARRRILRAARAHDDRARRRQPPRRRARPARAKERHDAQGVRPARRARVVAAPDRADVGPRAPAGAPGRAARIRRHHEPTARPVAQARAVGQAAVPAAGECAPPF